MHAYADTVVVGEVVPPPVELVAVPPEELVDVEVVPDESVDAVDVVPEEEEVAVFETDVVELDDELDVDVVVDAVDVDATVDGSVTCKRAATELFAEFASRDTVAVATMSYVPGGNAAGTVVTTVPDAPGFNVPTEIRASCTEAPPLAAEMFSVTSYAVPRPRLVIDIWTGSFAPVETTALPSEIEVGTTSGLGPAAALTGPIAIANTARMSGANEALRQRNKTGICCLLSVVLSEGG